MKYRKLTLTVVCLVLGLLAGFGVVDEIGQEYTDKGFKRALVAFAVARSLNGTISVAQGTEVAIQPAGIGINFAPGQILDPVNDLIERFSWIMLASSTSLGLQKVLMAIFASPGFTLVLGAVLIMLVLLLWIPGEKAVWLRSLMLKAALLLLFLRFVIPAMAFLGEGVFHYFLEEQYLASTERIEQTAEEIGKINESAERAIPALPDETLMEKAKRFYENATTRMDITSYIDRYKLAAADASEHAINLIVIFVIQTMLFPLFFLWVMGRSFRRLISFKWLEKEGTT